MKTILYNVFQYILALHFVLQILSGTINPQLTNKKTQIPRNTCKGDVDAISLGQTLNIGTILYTRVYFRERGNTIQSINHYTGKMSTCVKHMFKTTHVEHMFNMCETCVKIYICLTCRFFICLTYI